MCMDTKDRRIQELELIVVAQAKQIAEQQVYIEKWLARVEELERPLALNSSNSSKPPSSDGLRKTSKNRSLRDTDNKKFGGQKGHKGSSLKQIDNPDITIEYAPEKCSACGDFLIDAPTASVIEKQEIDVEV